MGVKASGFGVVLHRNSGGGSKIRISAQQVWVLLPDDDAESDDEKGSARPYIPRRQEDEEAARGLRSLSAQFKATSPPPRCPGRLPPSTQGPSGP